MLAPDSLWALFLDFVDLRDMIPVLAILSPDTASIAQWMASFLHSSNESPSQFRPRLVSYK